MKTITKRDVASFLSFAALLLLSCRQAPEVQGFNSQDWLSDPGGCKGIRARVWQQFEDKKSNLLGYEENDLGQLLGPADSKELLERGQKVYTYSISGSEKCAEQMPERLLVLRVNVTGKVSELQVVKNP